VSSIAPIDHFMAAKRMIAVDRVLQNTSIDVMRQKWRTALLCLFEVAWRNRRWGTVHLT